MGRSLTPDARFDVLVGTLRPVRDRLLAHPMYAQVSTLDDIMVFMEHHVFAVLDFMSLLKALQRGMTCVDVPWVPCGGRRARRLINEIVLAEESDEIACGEFTSHFELYCEAMMAAGANTSGINGFLARVRTGLAPQAALAQTSVPASVQAFVGTTFSIIDSASLPSIAAAFTFAREDVIPDMFRELVATMARTMPGRCELFQRYLERHIEVDGESHGPIARSMLVELCGVDSSRWEEAEASAKRAIEARLALWEGVVTAMARSRSSVAAR